MAKAGLFRDSIVIEKARDDQSLEGADGHIDLSKDANWNDWFTRRAEVVPTSGREFVSAQKVMAETTWMVTTYLDEMTCQITTRNKIRMEPSGRELQILASYEVMNQKRQWVCQCKEIGK